MAKQPKDFAASVRQRLLNLAREEGQVFDEVLVAFGLERLVYRLSVSDYRDRFVLKGGMLVTLWTADTGRFTRDIDFLAFGSDEETELKAAFSAIFAIDGGDGLVYDTASLTAVAIREDQIYGGMRLRTDAYLGNTRIPITVDLGFGDALGDPSYEIEYGSLLDFPAASIRAYSPATVIAEKFQAVVALGLANSRMKDLYDLWTLPKSVDIEMAALADAIRGTFTRRGTIVPVSCPVGLSAEFFADSAKMTQWRAYSNGTTLQGKPLDQVTSEIWSWLEAACKAAS
ncbi:MAG: nucleotidyl transferase AbiEii/AbiGii toxin family protein [Alphaproteobacteria bacterium]